MKFDPPRLARGPVSGRIYVITHGKITGHADDGREHIQSSVKYDVTDQFDALVAERSTMPSSIEEADRASS